MRYDNVNTRICIFLFKIQNDFDFQVFSKVRPTVFQTKQAYEVLLLFLKHNDKEIGMPLAFFSNYLF